MLSRVLVPPATFEEEAVDVDAILRRRVVTVFRHHVEVKLDHIDRDRVLSRKVLQVSGVGEWVSERARVRFLRTKANRAGRVSYLQRASEECLVKVEP